MIPSWASLLAVDDGTAARAKVVPVAPIAVNMRRVAAVMQIVDRAEDGPLNCTDVERDLARAGEEKVSGTAAFIIACGTGAGMIGAAAVHLDIGAAALVTVCPAMILVPGPPILNGAMDLLALRMPLGIARLGFATMVLTSIGAGLILGLRIGGQTLAVNGGDSTVPIYADVLAAGIAALPGGASPELLAMTVSNGATAALVVTGIALGLVIPMHARDALS